MSIFGRKKVYLADAGQCSAEGEGSLFVGDIIKAEPKREQTRSAPLSCALRRTSICVTPPGRGDMSCCIAMDAFRRVKHSDASLSSIFNEF